MKSAHRRLQAAIGLLAAASFLLGLVAMPQGIAMACSLICVALALSMVSALGIPWLVRAIESSIGDQLAESRSQFKQVVENLPVGLFTYHHGRFGFSNWAWDEQCMRLPGHAPSEAFVAALDPDDRKQVLAALQQFEKREEPFSLRFSLRDDSGGLRHIESRGVPVYNDEGNLSHILGFNLDITSAEKATFELNRKNQALESAFRDLEDNLEAMLASLVKAIEAKDPYTAGHSERVMEYSVRIGEALGLSKEDLHILRMGTLIHDIGKIGVPDSVLTKPDKLTPEEFDIIKRHPVTGFNLIREIPYFKACAPIVRWHHERLNGRGYPDGLSGDEIPLLVQISTVADMFDAMTSNRAYRRSLGVDVAMAELRRDAEGGVVNPEIVATWERLLREDGIIRDAEPQDLPMAA